MGRKFWPGDAFVLNTPALSLALTLTLTIALTLYLSLIRDYVFRSFTDHCKAKSYFHKIAINP